jgi:hypothetical protein
MFVMPLPPPSLTAKPFGPRERRRVAGLSVVEVDLDLDSSPL